MLFRSPMIEKSLGSIIESKGYLTSPEDQKKFMFKTNISVFIKVGKAMALPEISPHDQLEQLMKHTKALSEKEKQKLIDEAGQ